MRALVALAVLAPLALATPALAQEDTDAAEEPVDLLDDGTIDVGDTVFAVSDTASTRFPDADDAGPRVSKDSRLVVLVNEGERLRVLIAADDAFAWIPSSAVTTDKPAPDLDALLQQLGSQGGGGMGGGMGGGGMGQ